MLANQKATDDKTTQSDVKTEIKVDNVLNLNLHFSCCMCGHKAEIHRLKLCLPNTSVCVDSASPQPIELEISCIMHLLLCFIYLCSTFSTVNIQVCLSGTGLNAYFTIV